MYTSHCERKLEKELVLLEIDIDSVIICRRSHLRANITFAAKSSTNAHRQLRVDRTVLWHVRVVHVVVTRLNL